MTDTTLLGGWVRRFLLEHVIGEWNLARNTQRSYRDTLRLLLPFIARRIRSRLDRLTVDNLSVDQVRAFLDELENKRNCRVATRNQRLASIRSLARFVSLCSPEHVEWCGDLCSIRFKKSPRPLVTYLEKEEMDALLEVPSKHTAQGQRDRVLLLFMYNTGARADEVAHVRIDDLDLGQTPGRDPSSVLIHGKGNKLRHCPLWTKTANQLLPLMGRRSKAEHLFLNRRGEPLTRFGVHALVERYVTQLKKKLPGLAKKRVSPHTIHHTTATHLLRAGVDINTIRGWLGHVSLTTTNIYADVDLQMKAKALETCEVEDKEKRKRAKPWHDDKKLMEFLNKL